MVNPANEHSILVPTIKYVYSGPRNQIQWKGCIVLTCDMIDETDMWARQKPPDQIFFIRKQICNHSPDVKSIFTFIFLPHLQLMKGSLPGLPANLDIL